jgi:hypothetical protein
MIFNNITGIFNEDAATIFVINITKGYNLTEYKDLLQVTDASTLLLGFRYLVQEYLLGGLTSEMTVNQWISSYDADFFDIISQGDFFLGNDKDLIKTITPILNNNSESIKNAEMRIHTGSGSVDKVAKVLQINEKPYINKL